MDVFGLLGSALIGLAGGIGALLAQHYLAWIPQKRTELRRAAFDEAVDALAMYQVDVLDAELQTPKRDQPELRLATRIKMQRSRALVHAFFPAATSEAVNQALDAPISRNNIPHTDFGEKTARPLRLMAQDLGLQFVG
jgi:hypothetical protein